MHTRENLIFCWDMKIKEAFIGRQRTFRSCDGELNMLTYDVVSKLLQIRDNSYIKGLRSDDQQLNLLLFGVFRWMLGWRWVSEQQAW